MKAYYIIQSKKMTMDDEGFQEPLKSVYAYKFRPLCTCTGK